MDFAAAVDKVITGNLAQLQKPGVLSIRPGYEATGGWLTRKPAIVVTVAEKSDDVKPADRLPETLGGYPVDVRQADPLARMRATNPNLYKSVAAVAPPEMTRPEFPYERDVAGTSLAASFAAVAAARAPSKPQIPYTPAAGVTLDSVEDDMTITCHASPDAGWPTLKTFLSETRRSLTVGMYDFTSAHILETVQSTIAGKTFHLTLDHPAPNPTRDQTDEETVAALTSSIGAGFASAWALERADPKAASWIYPNAYHIKVAVRDSSVFWLSSGNWNNSNQPDIDPVADPAGSMAEAKKRDRDWHVIVDHAGLAKVYEAFLENDLQVAQANQAGVGLVADSMAAMAALVPPMAAVAPRSFKHFFEPKIITGRMKIQPILTPDNYVDCILPLITSAKTSFWMQTQYAHPSDREGDEKLAALIEAVAQKAKAGLDVRLIFSQFETLDQLEQLQDAGVDLSHVRIQPNVHNKGMIVDGVTVALGSQNWSADGVIRNRDATLIIYNEDAAKYWAEIFLHDWTNLARQQASD